MNVARFCAVVICSVAVVCCVVGGSPSGRALRAANLCDAELLEHDLREHDLPAEVHFEADGINRVAIDCGEQLAIVYAPPVDWPARQAPESIQSVETKSVDFLLLTHARRDVLAPAETLATTALEVIAPRAEQPLFDQPDAFWKSFRHERFNDYAQRSTKIRHRPLRVTRFVNDGETIECGNLSFQVLATPGLSSGGLTYRVDVDGKRIGFVGDLILGDGQILDLYSFQGPIHEAKIRGYHGYGGRLDQLLQSLRRVRDQQFDVLIPSRGPIISDPELAIDRLIDRVESLIRNYLSTTALHWYFKADNMTTVGQRILGKDATVELMPFAEHAPAPKWVWAFATTRVIKSKSGKAFMLDCWNQAALDAVQGLIDQGEIKSIDGIFVTHHHDDHTAMVQKAADQFRCPVYCVEPYHDVLRDPAAYHLPCVSENAIQNIRVKQDGEQLDWEEFQLTFHYFPGQTFYHGALHVQPQAGPSILFVGDSFAPSGFDDYCVQNRNLLHDDSGYLLCLKKLREYGAKQWLINQHIPQVFRFSDRELDHLESRYRERIAIQRELYFWDDPNYGVDENWASCYPYAQVISPGENTEVAIRITNHSAMKRDFEVVLHVPSIAAEKPDAVQTANATIESRQIGVVKFRFKAPQREGVHLVTADLNSDEMKLDRWVEGMVIVEPNNERPVSEQPAEAGQDLGVQDYLAIARDALPMRSGRLTFLSLTRKGNGIKRYAETFVINEDAGKNYLSSLHDVTQNQGPQTVSLREVRFVNGQQQSISSGVVGGVIQLDGSLDPASRNSLKKRRLPKIYEVPAEGNASFEFKKGVGPFHPFFGQVYSAGISVNFHDDAIVKDLKLDKQDDGTVVLRHLPSKATLIFKESELVGWEQNYGPTPEARRQANQVVARWDDGSVKRYISGDKGKPLRDVSEMIRHDPSFTDTTFQFFADEKDKD